MRDLMEYALAILFHRKYVMITIGTDTIYSDSFYDRVPVDIFIEDLSNCLLAKVGESPFYDLVSEFKYILFTVASKAMYDNNTRLAKKLKLKRTAIIAMRRAINRDYFREIGQHRNIRRTFNWKRDKKKCRIYQHKS